MTDAATTTTALKYDCLCLHHEAPCEGKTRLSLLCEACHASPDCSVEVENMVDIPEEPEAGRRMFHARKRQEALNILGKLILRSRGANEDFNLGDALTR